MIDPFPDMPNVTDIGDGLRMIETRDRGHCYRILEPDGKVSVIIALGSPPPQRPPNRKDPFEVRPSTNGHDVINLVGEVVATTTEYSMADRICKLLVLHEKAKARQAAPGSSPGEARQHN